MLWALLFGIITVYFLLDWVIRLLKVGGYSNKYVFITGCDSGFGRDLTIRLDRLGFPVFAGCLTQDGRQSLEDKCSSRVVTLTLDVSDERSIQEAFVTVKGKLPNDRSLWAVVNNAGVAGAIGVTEMLSLDDVISACKINLFGPIQVTKVFLPLLRKSQGRLVLITSVMGRLAATPTPYSVSKFGLEAFGDVCRREVVRFGVKVSMIEPGYFRTNILNLDKELKQVIETYDRSDPEVKEAYGKGYKDNLTTLVVAAQDFASPDTYKVVDAYVAAITSVYPRSRYVVGYDAMFFFIPLSFLPEWISDWFLANQRKKLAAKYQK